MVLHLGENEYQELNQSNLQEAIDNQFEGRDVVVSDNGDGTFTVYCLDTLKDYIISGNNIEEGIDWNAVLANAEKHPDQVTSTAIGVGTDGRAANMDLWEYSLEEDGNYNIKYKNENMTSDGRIIGTVPEYIIEVKDGQKVSKPVISMHDTFLNNTELKEGPSIPSTVKNLISTFLMVAQIWKKYLIFQAV